MGAMSTLREEAQNPATSPERLHELINLPGDRGNGDQDAGWCREYVAANPSTSPQTLRELAADQDDTMARFNAARNPGAGTEVLRVLAEDRLDFTSISSPTPPANAGVAVAAAARDPGPWGSPAGSEHRQDPGRAGPPNKASGGESRRRHCQRVVVVLILLLILLLLEVVVVALSVKDRVFAAAEQISAERRPTVSTVAGSGRCEQRRCHPLPEGMGRGEAGRGRTGRRDAGSGAGTGRAAGRCLLGRSVRRGE